MELRQLLKLTIGLGLMGWLPLRGADLFVSTLADSGGGSLRDAIQNASNGDTIRFETGLDGGTIRLTSGELVISHSVTIDASGLPNRIAISGENSSRVFRNISANVVLDSLIIENGRASDATFSVAAGNGGGIENESSLTIRRCTIRNSRAGNGSPGTFAFGGTGGGIHNGSTLMIEASTISNNRAGNGAADGTGGGGGGIFHQSGTLTITNSTITGNQSGDGNGDGSASGNGNGGFGGGIASYAPLVLQSTTLVRNATGSGDSLGIGGGLITIGGSATTTLQNTLIALNSMGPVGSPLTVNSDLLINGPDPTTEGVNIIGIAPPNEASFPPPSTPGTANPSNDYLGSLPNPLSIELSPLRDNGGPTETMLPLSGSLPIDRPEADTTTLLNSDQRGNSRLEGGLLDIGAVEFSSADQDALDEAVARAARKASLTNQLRKLKKKFKKARRAKKVSKIKRLRTQIRRTSARIRAL